MNGAAGPGLSNIYITRYIRVTIYMYTYVYVRLIYTYMSHETKIGSKHDSYLFTLVDKIYIYSDHSARIDFIVNSRLPSIIARKYAIKREL